jgi:hypothetical protein
MDGSTRRSLPRRVLGMLASGVLLACLAGPASAFAASPWWHLTSGARPSAPGVFGSYLSDVPLPGLVGCNRLPFSSSIEVAPDVREADTPTGLAVQLRVPQEISLDAEGLAESDVRDVTIALPSGMQLNPSIEADTQGCSTSEIGFTGFSAPPGGSGSSGARTATFTPSLPGSFGSSETFEPGVNFCPNASKIGEVAIHTPLLPDPLQGAMYLASRQYGPGPFEQLENQPGFVVGIYIVAEDSVAGVLVKIPGTLTREPVSGQLVMGLEDMPQLPIEDTEIHFFGGAHASFSTPALCGPYTTTASFAPWSGNEATMASSSFEINTGPDGSGPAGCPAPAQPTGGSEPGGGGGSSGSGAGSGSTAPPPATALSTSPSDATPLVTLMASKLVVSAASAPVRVACSEATCQGSIELTVQVVAKRHQGKSAVTHRETLVLATGSFTLAEGKNRTVILRLTAAGKKLLAHARRHPIAAKLILSVHDGKTATRSVLVG